MVCIRLTDEDYNHRTAQARDLGLTVSGLCERLVLEGKVDMSARTTYTAVDPAFFNELRRIGNNANQIAHALNSNLPPDVVFAWRTASELLRLLGREELQRQQAVPTHSPRAHASHGELVQQIAEALGARKQANDSPAAQARDVFQRSVRIHSARRSEDLP